jgi:selenocysteine lyase/cysteine desulfurase
LPAYSCGEIASAVPPGLEHRYYPVGQTLTPSVDFLSAQVRAGDHVLAIAYFGRPVGPDFADLARSRPDVGWVEDRAQALDLAAPAFGDWLVYSPRKLLGVPDGGVLVGRTKALAAIDPLPPTNVEFMLPSLERFEDVEEVDNERWYSDYAREERLMRVEATAMSRLSLELLKRFDVATDGELRRTNFEILHQRLHRYAFLPEVRPSFAPLGFPVRIESAATLSACLAEQRIFAARHWQNLPSDPSAFPDEHQLAKELLTLPCDYRYREEDMHRVANAVIAAMTGKP